MDVDVAVSDAGNTGWKSLLWLVSPEVCEEQREDAQEGVVMGARLWGR